MPGRDTVMLSTVDPERLRRVLAEVLDEDGMLSPYGIRSLSRRHLDEPFSVDVGGETFTVGYEPAESQTAMYGGNSNWRGPVWFPINFLVIGALRSFHEYLGDGFTVEHPARSGNQHTLAEVADDLARRLVSIFERGAGNTRPFNGGPFGSTPTSFSASD